MVPGETGQGGVVNVAKLASGEDGVSREVVGEVVKAMVSG